MERLRVLLPALWAGALLAVALVAAPSAFAVLPRPQAGLVVARLFAVEAHASLGLALVAVLLERWRQRAAGVDGARFTAGMLLPLAALFCTVAGYFALQPLMEAARAGRGPLGFAALHAASLGFYALKTLLVLALAWRVALRRVPSS